MKRTNFSKIDETLCIICSVETACVLPQSVIKRGAVNSCLGKREKLSVITRVSLRIKVFVANFNSTLEMEREERLSTLIQ